jgi:hypothetical protein
MSLGGNTAQQSEARGSEDLNALKRGEISMEEYLERRLELQVVAWGGALTEEQQGELRTILRQHFLDDPVLRHYADLATGQGSSR